MWKIYLNTFIWRKIDNVMTKYEIAIMSRKFKRKWKRMPSKNRMLRFHCVALVSNNQYFTSSLNKGNEWEAGIAPSFCLPGDIHCRGKLPVSDSTNCRHKGILKNCTWALLSINSFICSVFVHLKSYIYTSNKCKYHQGRVSLPIDCFKITSSSRACNKTYNRLISKWKKHFNEIY